MIAICSLCGVALSTKDPAAVSIGTNGHVHGGCFARATRAPAATLVAYPRSGTAWASQWLGFTHDPLDRVEAVAVAHMGGICCTASWLFNGLMDVRRARGPVVVLDRPLGDVNESLLSAGLGRISADAPRLADVPGEHFPWTDLWDNPAPIWKILRPDEPFNPRRHSEMSRLDIRLKIDKWRPRQPDPEEFKLWI